MKPHIHDITNPIDFLPPPPPIWQTWWFLSTCALALALALAILIPIIRKKNNTRRRKTQLEKARQRLKKLSTEAPSLPPSTVAVRISLIIRQYLEAAFGDPALFETIEEFTLRPHALEKLHPNTRKPVTTHLQNLSNLKYTPNPTPDQIPALIEQAGQILADIELNVTPADAPSR